MRKKSPATSPATRGAARHANAPSRRTVHAFDDVQSMVVFARVVQLRSFSAAAREQGSTTSAVSKRVARLEERLGARLLSRTTRDVAPTEAGAALFERCLHILRELEDAELMATNFSKQARGLLRVTAPVYLGEVYIAPLLPALLQRYPELHIDLSLNDRFVDLLDEGYDVAVRVGRVSDGTLVARTLAHVPVAACASPAYLAARGEPNTPHALSDHDCLRYTLEARGATVWRFRDRRGEPLTIPITSRLQSNYSGALREAAIAGAGIVLLPAFYVADALAEGRLRALLQDYAPAEVSVRGLYPAGKFVPPKTRVFIAWLAERLPAQLR